VGRVVTTLPAEYDLERLGRIRIRRGRRTDAPHLAAFHIRTHPAAFLPLLGHRFMTHLYRALIEHPEAVVIVAEQGDRVIGYSSGVLSMSAFYRRFFVRHGMAAAVAILPRLVRPRVFKKAWETARYNSLVEGMPEAEFSTLAVSEDMRSRHLGGLLSEGVIDGLRELGADEIRGTVSVDNGPMNTMMQRVGFEIVGQTVLHDGHPSNLYVLNCRS
jgi:ribosomal protein S18 acetylase RimI-like enzyme